VSGQLHTSSALSPGRELPVSVEWKGEWAPEPLWTQ